MLDRKIEPNDYVVLYGNIYQVMDLLGNPRNIEGIGMCRLLLIDKSKTTKSVKKCSKDMCIIDKDDILVWKIKRGY